MWENAANSSVWYTEYFGELLFDRFAIQGTLTTFYQPTIFPVLMCANSLDIACLELRIALIVYK